MKKIIIVLAFLFTGISAMVAQDMTTVFLSVPDEVLFGLEPEQKDRLLSNPEDTATVSVESALYAKIKRKAISPNYIWLQTSEKATTQIKLLPLINDSKIICVVKTVCGNICDSQVKFYTSKWVEIDQTGFMPKPNVDWFIKADADRNSQEFKNAYAALTMNPMKIKLFADNDSLSVKYEIKNYLSEDDYNKIQPFLIEEPKVLVWDKTSYK
ncbi:MULTISPECIES: DUF3256 family protein [unclassified Dysgonomonas]|uniref:DUF3256 family protein n=1 Tax=unclassified Dysgonomonas TaxID=2630389 RepID=UPI0013EC55E1|nr:MULTISPECIES: DUF3256 family protein [unclassified Dysgonomonas]